jgi:peptide/nickel transport system ATP-binding protein
MLVHLEESTAGQILFEGEDITVLNKRDMKKFREHSQIIFQDPYSSLDARYTIEDSIKEPLLYSGRYTRAQAQERVSELMDLVGISPRLRMSYPHELDGGRRQRVGIARALALDPEFIVCDEPVSALDVSIQAQVLNLLKQLQQDRGLTYMFITHDLSVVKHISNDICVMYLGQLVETSPSDELFQTQYHPYTKALLSAIPSTDIRRKMNRIVLKGEISSPIDPKPGCRFAARCPYAAPECAQPQKLEEIAPDHFVACCKVRQVNGL